MGDESRRKHQHILALAHLAIGDGSLGIEGVAHFRRGVTSNVRLAQSIGYRLPCPFGRRGWTHAEFLAQTGRTARIGRLDRGQIACLRMQAHQQHVRGLAQVIGLDQTRGPFDRLVHAVGIRQRTREMREQPEPHPRGVGSRSPLRRFPLFG